VFALAGVAWLVALGLFAELFRRTFGFGDKHLPLFVFMASSPFFLKNFMHTLGHFDIYGCLLATCLLLIPARSVAYVLLAAAFAVVLVLIHHIHVLMYVPTIAAIVVLRHYLVQGIKPQNAAAGVAAVAISSALFVLTQFYGTVDAPPQAFADQLQSRMADPSRTDLLGFAYIWYQPLSKEIADTWARLPHNILGVPVFVLLIWLHTPLWRYFAGLIGALASEMHRRIVIAALAIVSAGYLVMFVIVFDYSRWISNWAVCMFLILHAVKMMPASRETPLIPTDDMKTTIFGVIVTLIPRVGIVRPF
jgi:multisubunit Na+/H+ antiporter MnhE subunit